jgi:hypothetical protein
MTDDLDLMTPEEAQAEIDAIRSDPSNPYNIADQIPRLREAAVARMGRLYEIAHGADDANPTDEYGNVVPDALRGDAVETALSPPPSADGYNFDAFPC